MENFIVIKNKKYLSGYGYTTFHGNRFFWSKNIDKAVLFTEEKAIYYSSQTKGKYVKTENK